MRLFLISCAATGFAQSKLFTLQVRSLDTPEPALALVKQLQAVGLDAYCLQSSVPGKGVMYRVRVGRFSTAMTAQSSGEKLRRTQTITTYYVSAYEMPAPLPSAPTTATNKRLTTDTDNTRTGMIESSVTQRLLSPEQPPIIPGEAASLSTSTSNTATSIRSGIQFGDESGWEIYLAGGGSFWSHQDSALSISDVLTVTPNQPLPNDKLAIRQSFAPGGRIAVGLVKNINARSALEFSYTYGTDNFKVTALENGSNVQVSEIKKGMTRSLGMRSHIAAINYRYSLVNNEHTRFYLTGGFNVTVFTPSNNGLDQLFGQLPNFDPDDFKQKPSFRTVAAPGLNVGAGLLIKMNDRMGLRLDVRDYMSFTKRVKGSTELKTGEKLEASLFGNTVHNLVPTLGIVVTPR